MRLLSLLVILTSCASGPDWDEKYDACDGEPLCRSSVHDEQVAYEKANPPKPGFLHYVGAILSGGGQGLQDGAARRRDENPKLFCATMSDCPIGFSCVEGACDRN